MSSKRKDTRRIHRRSMIVTTLGALAVLAVATPATATTPPGSDETTTTAAAETTTTEAATSSTAAATSTSAAAATTTAAPAPTSNFATVLAEQCEGDTGQQLLASGLQVVMGTDGSLRIVEVLLTCDVEFVGAVDPELGRPLTNVEAIIADPENRITPNQAQTDLLNEELAIYWRVTDAWVQSQAGASALDEGVTSTVPAESSVPAGDVATSEPGEPATTG